MDYAVTNCTVYTGEELLRNSALVIRGGRIESIVKEADIPRDLEVVDLEGVTVTPGFLDLQVNGSAGLVFSEEPTPERGAAIAMAYRARGTTAMLRTRISSPWETILQAVESVRELMERPETGVLGLHLEGPFINAEKSGVHDPAFIREPTDFELNNLIERGSGVVKMVTVAPEVVGESRVKRLARSGMVVSAGHTNATYRQMLDFERAGGRMVTHLFNAMSQFGAREPGAAGAALDSGELWAGILADGVHVDPAGIRLAWRAKGEKLILVSDAVALPGEEPLAFTMGGREITCEGGMCRTAEGKLAGSLLDMAAAVRLCVMKAGIPLADVLRMATAGPARLLGLEGRYGYIREGRPADVFFLDPAKWGQT